MEDIKRIRLVAGMRKEDLGGGGLRFSEVLGETIRESFRRDASTIRDFSG
jgi:hypothetical protein